MMPALKLLGEHTRSRRAVLPVKAPERDDPATPADEDRQREALDARNCARTNRMKIRESADRAVGLTQGSQRAEMRAVVVHDAEELLGRALRENRRTTSS